MKVCMPVKSNLGMESPIYGHFGSAPFFLVFDAETNQLSALSNQNKHHAHGQCNPLQAFEDSLPDIVVVGGIGGGALSKLNSAGVRVFKAEGKTVAENINALTTRGLPEFTLQHTCQGHDHHHPHDHAEGGHQEHGPGEKCCH